MKRFRIINKKYDDGSYLKMIVFFNKIEFYIYKNRRQKWGPGMYGYIGDRIIGYYYETTIGITKKGTFKFIKTKRNNGTE